MFYNGSSLKEVEVLSEAQRIISRDRQPLTSLVDGISLWTISLYGQGYARSTIHTYKRPVELLLQYDPTPDQFSIEAYLALLRERGLGNNSLLVHNSAFKSFFNFLHQNNLWPSNPASYVKNPKKDRRRRPIPSTRTVQALLSYDMALGDRLMLELFLDTGLRVAELAAIPIRDINLMEQEITVIGKGEKQRIVPFSESVRTLLEQWILEARKWLFPACQGSGHIKRQTVQRHLGNLCKEAGIGHLTPHQLRHFYATYMLDGGADIKVVSETLGHVSVSTTLDLYYHINQQKIKDEHKKHSPIKGLKEVQSGTRQGLQQDLG